MCYSHYKCKGKKCTWFPEFVEKQSQINAAPISIMKKKNQGRKEKGKKGGEIEREKAKEGMKESRKKKKKKEGMKGGRKIGRKFEGFFPIYHTVFFNLHNKTQEGLEQSSAIHQSIDI